MVAEYMRSMELTQPSRKDASVKSLHFPTHFLGGIFDPQNLHGTPLFFRLAGTICSLPHLGHFRLRRNMVPIIVDMVNGFISFKPFVSFVCAI